ncbi:hypothetical protein BDR26DRAFT_1004655 [Obelidium mucronatum]|nr:hypothetical protein BDR26DRAFT_1004655 [Obelidium mucronatum]
MSAATLCVRSPRGASLPEVAQLWPHSALQSEKIPLVLTRMMAWKNIVEELLVFITAIQTIEKESAREYTKLADRLQRLGTTTHETVTFETSTLIPIDVIQHSLSKISDQHLKFERAMNDTCYRLLLDLKSEIIRKIKSFKSDTDTLTRIINKSHASTIEMITLHEKQLKDIQQFDEKVVDGLKIVLVDFLLAKEQQHDATTALLQQARAHLNSLESQSPFQSFAAESQVFDKSVWSTTRTLSDFSYKIQEIKIVKQSVMSRQYFWSRTGWAQALFVVTESGYLHCFKQVHGKARGDEARRRALDQKNTWNFSKKNVAVIPPSAEALQVELHETPAYNDLDAPSTFFSICLNNSGRITVNVVPTKANLFVFSIDIFKTPRDPIACKRYEIKANTESEMIDWVSFLKEQIESYLPEGPPEPLFSPAHEIIDKVEVLRRPPPSVPVAKPYVQNAQQSQETIVNTTSEVDFSSLDDDIVVAGGDAAVKAKIFRGQGTGEITGRTFTSATSSASLMRPAGARKAPEFDALVD